MPPKKSQKEAVQQSLGLRLDSFLNMDDSLIQLSQAIDWSSFDEEYDLPYVSNSGRPPLPSRVMVGLNFLRYMLSLSDEALMDAFIQNPYIQYFCGYETFQYDAPCYSFSMKRWRKRIGEKGEEKFLRTAIEAAKKLQLLKNGDLKRATVDTTV